MSLSLDFKPIVVRLGDKWITQLEKLVALDEVLNLISCCVSKSTTNELPSKKLVALDEVLNLISCCVCKTTIFTWLDAAPRIVVTLRGTHN